MEPYKSDERTMPISVVDAVLYARLKHLCQEYYRRVWEDGYAAVDATCAEYAMFEAAMKMVLGENVFEILNQRERELNR